MERPPDNVIAGYEIMHIECGGCGRRVEWKDMGNDLVGCQDRLRCRDCGHVGASLTRVWHVGERTSA